MTAGQLILVGAPAAGKTTVGRLVAERAGLPFTDTDELLSEHLGMSLPEAWASLPEPELVTREVEVCQAAMARPGVIALGSRSPAEPRIRALLAGRRVLWLRVSSTQLTRRLGMASLGMETLAAVRARMDALLGQREPWYEEVATLRLDTDRLDVGAVADRVEQAWEGSA
ncbi:MAG: shikimate kinase [Actinobacteria bacterium]|nr:shikimate kinase [Actinomycetota bacterium]